MFTIILLILFTLLCMAMGTHRSWSSETQAVRNALVFQGRNQAYGAYTLRKGYHRRLTMAFGAAFGLLVLLTALLKALVLLAPATHAQAPAPTVVDVVFDRIYTPPPPTPKPAENPPVALPPAKSGPAAERPKEAVEDPVAPALPRKDSTDAGSAPAGTPRPGGEAPAPGGTGEGPSAGPSIGGNDRTWDGYEVQVMPEFPGGEAALHAWVNGNLGELPTLTGRDEVYVQFTVLQDGSVQQVQAVKGKSKALREAAERALRRMPRWSPAQVDGHPVRCRLTLPIRVEVQ